MLSLAVLSLTTERSRAYNVIAVTDMNECQQPSLCGSGSCVNRPGSYDCRCPGGMIFDTININCISEFFDGFSSITSLL